MKVQLEASTPLGYQQLSALSAAVGLTAPTGAVYAIIQAESQNIRWRDDGTNPTASVGMYLALGGEMVYDGDFTKLKFIEVVSGAKVNATFYGRKNAL